MSTEMEGLRRREERVGSPLKDGEIREVEGSQRLQRVIYKIPVADIEVSEDLNVRKSGADKGLDELADSIEQLGLLCPVMLLGEYGKPPYKLVVGQRRFLAHKTILARRGAKWKDIEAVFVGELSDVGAKIRSLAENVHRVDINDADAADAVTELYRGLGRSVQRVAKASGLSVTRVNRYLMIQERASKAAMRMVREGKVRGYDVKRALDVAGDDQEKADRILKVMVRLTPTERGRLVEYGREDPGAPVEQMEERARMPRVRRTILVDLTVPIRRGLERASKALEIQPEEIAALALEEWLRKGGYIG